MLPLEDIVPAQSLVVLVLNNTALLFSCGPVNDSQHPNSERGPSAFVPSFFLGSLLTICE
jgi:hypothetical protein